MVRFASYLRHVLCKTRLIFPRINGPIDPFRFDPVGFRGWQKAPRGVGGGGTPLFGLYGCVPLRQGTVFKVLSL